MSIYRDNTPSIVDSAARRWWIVANDPRSVVYADRDWEAVDATNWDALVADLIGICEPNEFVTLSTVRPHWSDRSNTTTTTATDLDGNQVDDQICDDLLADRQVLRIVDLYGADLLEVPYQYRHRPLLVLDGSAAYDEWVSIARSLSDYPLLDESAYSELEFDAWCEYLDRDAPWDVRRDLIADHGIDPDADEYLDELCDLIPTAAERLDYFSGFTAEHSPSLASLVLEVFAERYEAKELQGRTN